MECTIRNTNLYSRLYIPKYKLVLRIYGPNYVLFTMAQSLEGSTKTRGLIRDGIIVS